LFHPKGCKFHETIRKMETLPINVHDKTGEVASA